MTRIKRIGLDTSVILRLLIGEPVAQAERALQFLSESTAAGHTPVVSDIVVCETYFALHKYYGVSKRQAIDVLVQMLAEGPITTMDGSVVLDALKASQHGSQKPGFVDRLIHAQYRSAAAGMVSFEKAAKRLSDTQVL